MKCADITWR